MIDQDCCLNLNFCALCLIKWACVRGNENRTLIDWLDWLTHLKDIRSSQTYLQEKKTFNALNTWWSSNRAVSQQPLQPRQPQPIPHQQPLLSTLITNKRTLNTAPITTWWCWVNTTTTTTIITHNITHNRCRMVLIVICSRRALTKAAKPMQQQQKLSVQRLPGQQIQSLR